MQTPDGVMDVLLLPMILTLFGVAIFFGSIQAEKTYGVKSKWQWTCLIFLAMAAFVGTQQIIPLWTNVTYSWTIHTYNLKKVEIGLYASFLLPYILGGLFTYLIFFKKKARKSIA